MFSLHIALRGRVLGFLFTLHLLHSMNSRGFALSNGEPMSLMKTTAALLVDCNS